MARKLAPDKWLFAATVGLALFGVVMVYSASACHCAKRERQPVFTMCSSRRVFVAIGFVVMLLAMQFNYQQLKNRGFVYRAVDYLHLGLIFGVWFLAASMARTAGSNFRASRFSRAKCRNSRS
jgi:cell division protein FtsW (lipid II flippase)